MSTSQSGVIGCHSISTTRPEAVRQKSPPFKAWPQIKDWRIYYTLPTIYGIYRPEVLFDPTNASSIWIPDLSPEEILEGIISCFPSPEQFVSQIVPILEENYQQLIDYYQSQFGIELDKQSLQHDLANALASLGKRDSIKSTRATNKSGVNFSLSYLSEIFTNMIGLDDTYSITHEVGHLFSLSLIRPTITQLNTAWSAIEELLQQAVMGSYEGFWPRFNYLNNKRRTAFPTH
jgi:hypothetical protein